MGGKGGRPKAELVLSEEERHTLEGWARRRTTAHGLAVRSVRSRAGEAFALAAGEALEELVLESQPGRVFGARLGPLAMLSAQERCHLETSKRSRFM